VANITADFVYREKPLQWWSLISVIMVGYSWYMVRPETGVTSFINYLLGAANSPWLSLESNAHEMAWVWNNYSNLATWGV
jgi:hypothetical protein